MRLVRWWIYAWVAVETWRKYRRKTTTIAELHRVLKDVWISDHLEQQLYEASPLLLRIAEPNEEELHA